MAKPKQSILAISGSATINSSNEKILHAIKNGFEEQVNIEVCNIIKELPHFNPGLTEEPPLVVQQFFDKIKAADGVLICTPEYIFSIPAILKNALEWTVSTLGYAVKFDLEGLI